MTYQKQKIEAHSLNKLAVTAIVIGSLAFIIGVINMILSGSLQFGLGTSLIGMLCSIPAIMILLKPHKQISLLQTMMMITLIGLSVLSIFMGTLFIYIFLNPIDLRGFGLLINWLVIG